MKRWLLPWFAVMIFVIGCQDQHALKKQETMEHWTKARVSMIIDMAQQQFQNGDYQKAQQTTYDALDIDPQYIPAHLLLGQIYLDQNKYSLAQKSFQHCLSLNPTHAQANYYLGVILEKRGLMPDALDHYRLAWETDTHNVPYLLAVVETLAAQEHYQEALDMLMDFLQEGESDVSVYVAAGTILTTMGKSGEAVSMYRQAMYLAPDNDQISESLAFALLATDEPEESVAIFERLEQKARDQSQTLNWSHYLAMGDCYMKMSQYFKAQRCFEKVSEQDNSNPRIWIRLAQTAMARDDLSRAQTWAQRAISLDPGNTEAQMALAFVILKQKNYEEAESILNQILTNESDNLLAYCLLGQCYEGLGQSDKALDCYAQALRLDPHDSLAQTLMRQMNVLQVGQSSSSDKF